MSTCKHDGCTRHADKYKNRPILCRLSVHRHWNECHSNSPPPWYWECLLCGYTWIRTLGKGEHASPWWYRLPWVLQRIVWWWRWRFWKTTP